jgi:tRNA-splicing ligase RtcB
LCYSNLKNQSNFGKAIGSLGGGNHFIEINKSDSGKQYLVIHSGSRNLGKQVAEYYQKTAIDMWKINGLDYAEHRQILIDGCRKEKRGYDIPAVLKRFDEHYKNARPQYPAELCFLTGNKMANYLSDMRICQKYASLNRVTIANTILKSLNSSIYRLDYFETIHNYINLDDGIMRKGAVSARAGEKLIIPMNRKDGSLLCVGKGNADWNFSAPHGSGRIMSRSEAKRTLDLQKSKDEMEGIYSTTVNESTLDESPDAYKPMEEIVANIGDTVDIVDIIRPIYNFKSSE